MAIRFLADENFNNRIVRGVLRRSPGLDIVRVQTVGLDGYEDPDVLSWAAEQNRILLTHDVSTMKDFALERIDRGERMPGVVVVGLFVPIARAIEDIHLIAECNVEGEWDGQIRHIPL